MPIKTLFCGSNNTKKQQKAETLYYKFRSNKIIKIYSKSSENYEKIIQTSKPYKSRYLPLIYSNSKNTLISLILNSNKLLKNIGFWLISLYLKIKSGFNINRCLLMETYLISKIFTNQRRCFTSIYTVSMDLFWILMNR